MKFVTYTATPELEQFPERERFGVWCSMHQRLMLTNADYQRQCRDFHWRTVGVTLVFMALSMMLGRFAWPPLGVQVPLHLALTLLYVMYIVRLSFGAQQFRNEQVGRALREQVAWSLGGERIIKSVSQPYRWTSKIRLFGVPLYDVYFPSQAESKSLKQSTATGVFAVGISAKGIVAVGVLARGIITLGVCSLGVVSFGAISISMLFAAGTLAVAPISFGVVAIGIVTGGVSAFGWKVLFSVA